MLAVKSPITGISPVNLVSCPFSMTTNTVNVDIFACIHFCGFEKWAISLGFEFAFSILLALCAIMKIMLYIFYADIQGM